MSKQEAIDRIHRRDSRGFYDSLVLVLIGFVYLSSSKSETLQDIGVAGFVGLFIGLNVWIFLSAFADTVRVAIIEKDKTH